MRKRKTHIGVGGFTLIEILMTILIIGIAATTIVPFMGWKLMRSGEVERRLENDVALNRVMESMISHYRNDLLYGCGSLDICKTRLNELYAGSDDTDNIGSAGMSMSNVYGEYYVVENIFVDYNNTSKKFTPAEETPSAFLLVTIKQNTSSKLSLTYLFSAYDPSPVPEETSTPTPSS